MELALVLKPLYLSIRSATLYSWKIEVYYQVHGSKTFRFFPNFKRGTRRGTRRRISIHPNFIQRFSTTNNSGVPSPTVGPSALRVPSEARPRSGTSVTAETVVSLRTEIQTEPAPAQRVDQEGSVSEGHGNSSQSNGKTYSSKTNF